MRFAPAIALAKSLLDEGATVSAYDPAAAEKAKAVLPNINYCADPYQAAQGADAILIVTEWDEFRHLDWKRLLSVVEQPLVIDGRNMFSPEEISGHGFRYISVGRAAAVPSAAGVADGKGYRSAQTDKDIQESLA